MFKEICIGSKPIQPLMIDCFSLIGLREVSVEDLTQRRMDGYFLNVKEGEYLSLIHSMIAMDFILWIPGCKYPIYIDVKDKLTFVPENWGISSTEKNDWVIFDETSVKKILNIGFCSFGVVQDMVQKRIYVWNSQVIGLSYRKWAMREDMGNGIHKYKLLYPILNAEEHSDLGSMILSMVDWVNTQAFKLSCSGPQHTWFNPKFDKCVVNRQQRTSEHKVTDLHQANIDVWLKKKGG